MNKEQKVDFSHLTKKQAQSKDHAFNAGKQWTKEEIDFLARHMFDTSMEDLAYSLQRTVYSIETQLSKNPELIAIRKQAGDKPIEKEARKKKEVNYFVSSNIDELFGKGD